METYEDHGFNDILQQAEKLTAEIDATNELPRVQRNLRQVLEAGQQLLQKASQGIDKASDVEARAYETIYFFTFILNNESVWLANNFNLSMHCPLHQIQLLLSFMLNYL